jgi:RNA polymerase sigma factor (sigma-70 family)
LPPKQREIIYLRFYENYTLSEIGQKQGYTKESARQNVNKSISHLKELCKQEDFFGV